MNKNENDRRIKVCHVTNYLPGFHRGSGGAEQACLNIIKTIYAQGVENVVVATKPLKQPNEKEFDFYSVTISEDLIGWKFSFIKRIFYFDIVSFFSLRKILKKTKPDIVHLYNFDLFSLSAVSAAKSLKIPVVFSVYDYWVFSSDKGITFNDGWMRRKIFSHFLKKIDIFIVLSRQSKELLIKNGINENRIRIIPLMMDTNSKLLEKVEIEPKSIIFAGWVQPRKGLLVLIQAMSKIIKKIPKTKLYIFGMKEDKKYREKIDSFIKNNNLYSSIVWNNEQDKTKSLDKYFSTFNKAEVVVVPEQWQNMSPVIVAEGMAAGKVIVASKIGGIPDIIEDGVSGFLAEYDSPSDFALKIIESLSNQSYSDNIKENARRRFNELFNNKKNAEKLKDAYFEIV